MQVTSSYAIKNICYLAWSYKLWRDKKRSYGITSLFSHIFHFCTLNKTIKMNYYAIIISIPNKNFVLSTKLCFKNWVLHRKLRNEKQYTISVERIVDMSVDMSFDVFFHNLKLCHTLSRGSTWRCEYALFTVWKM